MPYNLLTPEEENIIIHKGTEPPFSGKYNDFFEDGIYTCKRCGAPLYTSASKFDAGCGWPSFDDEIPEAVKRTPDPDGIRTEISCTHCGAHLGHIFTGENLTPKNVRHCVNSLALNFLPTKKTQDKRHYFASGIWEALNICSKKQTAYPQLRAAFGLAAKNLINTFDKIL